MIFFLSGPLSLRGKNFTFYFLTQSCNFVSDTTIFNILNCIYKIWSLLAMCIFVYFKLRTFVLLAGSERDKVMWNPVIKI